MSGGLFVAGHLELIEGDVSAMEAVEMDNVPVGAVRSHRATDRRIVLTDAASGTGLLEAQGEQIVLLLVLFRVQNDFRHFRGRELAFDAVEMRLPDLKHARGKSL